VRKTIRHIIKVRMIVPDVSNCARVRVLPLPSPTHVDENRAAQRRARRAKGHPGVNRFTGLSRFSDRVPSIDCICVEDPCVQTDTRCAWFFHYTN
ncbi:unnamed protein product, partial [Rangifer tarandus platyrhynchus]